MAKKTIWRSEHLWSLLSDFWTIVLMVFLVVNFFLRDHYSYLVQPLSVLYFGILGLYVGMKEVRRWHHDYQGHRSGEFFVVLWTGVVLMFLLFSLFLGSGYRFPIDAITIYLMVLSVFALTQQSKYFYKERNPRSDVDD